MSISTSTAAERIAVRDKATITVHALQPFAQDSVVLNTEQVTEVDAVLAALNAALLAADAPQTSAVVANGGTVNVENSAGALDSPATAVVADGVLTSVKLAATKTIVTNSQALTGVAPTGVYVSTVTFTVANGVITAITLS